MKKLRQFFKQRKLFIWFLMMVILTSGMAWTIFRKEAVTADLSFTELIHTDSLSLNSLQKSGRGISKLIEAVNQQSKAQEIMRRDTIAEEDLQLMKNIDQSINNLIHAHH